MSVHLVHSPMRPLPPVRSLTMDYYMPPRPVFSLIAFSRNGIKMLRGFCLPRTTFALSNNSRSIVNGKKKSAADRENGCQARRGIFAGRNDLKRSDGWRTRSTLYSPRQDWRRCSHGENHRRCLKRSPVNSYCSSLAAPAPSFDYS